jgi:hypothetical protein
VGARLHHEGGTGIAGTKRGDHFAGIDDHFLGEDLARFVEDAHVVVTIPEIQSDGQVFSIHMAEGLYPRRLALGLPPSHSYWFGSGFISGNP